MPLPPPPDFMAMQVQMDQQRRQREQDALQNMLMQQEQQDRITKKQDRIEQLGIDAIKAGGKLKDVEARYRGEATEQTAAGWRIYADAAKRNAAETEGAAQGATAQSTLAQLLTNSGGQISTSGQIPGIDPAMLDQLKLQMMAGGEASPASEINRMAALAQSNAWAAEEQFNTKRVQENTLARDKSAIIENRASRLDATTRSRNKLDRVEEEQRQVALKLYSGIYQDLLIAENGGDPAKQTEILEAAAADPRLGTFGPANAALIELNALSGARSAQDAITVARDIEKNSGVRVPMRVAQMVVDGKAVEEPLTGLPFRMPTDKNAARIGMIQNAVDALARIETYGKRIAASGKVRNAGILNAYNIFSDKYSTGTVEARTSNLARSVGAGIDDPDIAAYDAAREAYKLAYTYIVTGATTNEKQIESIEAQLPKLTELVRDERTGGINPGARRRLDGSFRNLITQVLQSSLVDANVTQARFRSGFDQRIADYESIESGPGVPGTAPAGAQQGVQIPGARIRTGP